MKSLVLVTGILNLAAIGFTQNVDSSPIDHLDDAGLLVGREISAIIDNLKAQVQEEIQTREHIDAIGLQTGAGDTDNHSDISTERNERKEQSAIESLLKEIQAGLKIQSPDDHHHHESPEGDGRSHSFASRRHLRHDHILRHRHGRQHHDNIDKRQASSVSAPDSTSATVTSSAIEGWRVWQAMNEWSVDADSRTIYRDHTDSSDISRHTATVHPEISAPSSSAVHGNEYDNQVQARREVDSISSDTKKQNVAMQHDDTSGEKILGANYNTAEAISADTSSSRGEPESYQERKQAKPHTSMAAGRDSKGLLLFGSAVSILVCTAVQFISTMV